MGQNVNIFLKDKNEGKGIFFYYFFFSIILMIFHYN